MRLAAEGAGGTKLTFARSQMKLTNYVTVGLKRDVLGLNRSARFGPLSGGDFAFPALEATKFFTRAGIIGMWESGPVRCEKPHSDDRTPRE